MTLNAVTPALTRTALRHAVSGFTLASILAGAPFWMGSATAQTSGAPRPTAQTGTSQSGTEQATALLADSVNFTGTQLIASGNVEVHYGTAVLTAQRIVFDRASGSLTLDGPIHLSDNNGATVILASAAQLDTDLRNGILTSARLVIDQQFQLAAQSMQRIDGRYTQLSHTVSSACRICENSPIPVWQIRAKEVVHDGLTRQIYFTDAQFRLWGVPVFFLPRLRLPDPTLKRATGFLVPELRSSSDLGSGIQIPYFIAIGDHRDLTVSPYLSSHTRTLDLQYRQAYRTGTLEVTTAVTNDDTQDDLRGYMFVQGQWDIGNDLNFGIDLRATSDISYLLDYDVYSGDRLTSRIWVDRYSAHNAFDAQLTSIRTLRDSEVAIEDTLPFLLGDISYKHQYTPQSLGGTAWFELSGSGYYRTSDDDIDGMDVMRASAEGGWKNSTTFGPGFRLDGMTSVTVDTYAITQNSSYDSLVGRVTPAAQLRLSYPLERITKSGAHQTIEPIAQLSWADSYGSAVPNSDSVLTEFDFGNLFSTSQFAGADRRGEGVRGAFGLKFTHTNQRAIYGFSFGRIIALQDDTNYTQASGLSQKASDYLIGASMQLDQNLLINSRALVDSDLSLTKWETRLDLIRSRYNIGLVHSYVIADADENRDTDLSELSMDSTFQIKDNWTASVDYRYDFEESKAASAGLELEYSNECARVKFGVSRRFTDTDSLDPTTNYSIAIGFGAYGNQSQSTQGTCGI
ncbi:LPS-assembly protein LptD [Pacificibacter marinus]|uniref:LPS-assembly protein LptD n=1 Tax=Pacificibacter marinus TaxID=658057 RepID=A0A1Y5RRH7_9RHOB|nr:LPS assembly protein LptD [Pacificibacter marinus]SEL31735.1 LPS-assembly protein [Pacificibacter marinus]SLN22587.1 LPS-assembly protein LptD precursor [Pacificibacter marinus]